LITALYSKSGEKAVRVEGEAAIARIVAEAGGCLWVDIEEPAAGDRAILADAFGFHPLAVENCLTPTDHPRLDDYGDYLYLVVHAIPAPPPAAPADPSGGPRKPLEADEIDIFLGRNYLVTWHRRPVEPLGAVRQRCLEIERAMDRGPDRVLADLLDRLADGYVAAMGVFERSIDGLEDRLFKSASAMALKEVFVLKKGVLRLKRLVAPQREILNRMARGEFKVVSPEESLFFRDAYDHVVRVTEMAETFRDTVASAMEVYLTVVSNRTNEVMKVLTVFSIVLMTMSLLAGIYGMNVDLPISGDGNNPAAFYILLGLMAATGGGLLLFFRKRRWI
jgi:magnesium transporter